MLVIGKRQRIEGDEGGIGRVVTPGAALTRIFAGIYVSVASEIEQKCAGWSYHFMCEHSIFAYLSFLVYITDKKIYDCSGLEKHVKECFEKVDASFMPDTSLAMLEAEGKQELAEEAAEKAAKEARK